MSCRGDVIEFILWDLVTKSVDIILEDKVINLTGIAWVNRWQSLFISRWPLQIFKPLLLKLELPIKLVDHELLVLAYLDLLIWATAFGPKENDISILNKVFLQMIVVILFWLLLSLLIEQLKRLVSLSHIEDFFTTFATISN